MTDSRFHQGGVVPPALAYLSTLNGDAPCVDCGTPDNIVWFTDSVFWNEVMRLGAGVEPGAALPSPILCLPCFIARAEKVGMQPTGWRVLPEWPWRTGCQA